MPQEIDGPPLSVSLAVYIYIYYCVVNTHTLKKWGNREAAAWVALGYAQVTCPPPFEIDRLVDSSRRSQFVSFRLPSSSCAPLHSSNTNGAPSPSFHIDTGFRLFSRVLYLLSCQQIDNLIDFLI